MIGFVRPNTSNFRASGSWTTNNNNAHIYTTDCSISGNTLTMNSAKEVTIGDNYYDCKNITIGSIYRVL